MRNPNIQITPMVRSTNYFRDRATEINAQMAVERDRQRRFAIIAASICAAGVIALSGLAGFIIADIERADDLRNNAATYQLVSTVEGESDIIDHGLSRSDCQGYLLAGGNNLTCEGE